jgi:hypothetical protein
MQGCPVDHGHGLPSTAAGAMFAATGHATKVTTAAAISHIAYWQIAMRSRHIVISMAGCAFPLISREWPCNNLVVGSMTVNTNDACSVITGIIG